MAIETRCRRPPLNSPGYDFMRVFASGKPTWPRTSSARARALFRLHDKCCLITSVSWRPTVKSGLRVDEGSWNTMPTSPPRIRRSCRVEHVSMSVPSKTTRPPAMRPGSGTSRITA